MPDGLTTVVALAIVAALGIAADTTAEMLIVARDHPDRIHLKRGAQTLRRLCRPRQQRHDEPQPTRRTPAAIDSRRRPSGEAAGFLHMDYKGLKRSRRMPPAGWWPCRLLDEAVEQRA